MRSSVTDVQAAIDEIHSGQLSEAELTNRLLDPRALVRANALMALRGLTQIGAPTIQAVLRAASHPQYGAVRLIGTIDQRTLAYATLAWMNDDAANQAYRRALAELSSDDARHIEEVVTRGPE